MKLKRSYMKRGTSEFKRVRLVRRRRAVLKPFKSRGDAEKNLAAPSVENLAAVKHGRTRLRAKPESREAKEFKRAVRERDDYTCQRCFKVRDKHIHVHHIAPRSRRPDLKLVVSNGICLDWDCHRWAHDHPIEATALGLLSVETYERAMKDAA